MKRLRRWEAYNSIGVFHMWSKNSKNKWQLPLARYRLKPITGPVGTLWGVSGDPCTPIQLFWNTPITICGWITEFDMPYNASWPHNQETHWGVASQILICVKGAWSWISTRLGIQIGFASFYTRQQMGLTLCQDILKSIFSSENNDRVTLLFDSAEQKHKKRMPRRYKRNWFNITYSNASLRQHTVLKPNKKQTTKPRLFKITL